MTPMKKKDLKYAMRTAINLAEFANKMNELVRRMTYDIEEGVKLSGITSRETEPHGFRLYEDVENLLAAYNKFLDEAITVRNNIETIWNEEDATIWSEEDAK